MLGRKKIVAECTRLFSEYKLQLNSQKKSPQRSLVVKRIKVEEGEGVGWGVYFVEAVSFFADTINHILASSLNTLCMEYTKLLFMHASVTENHINETMTMLTFTSLFLQTTQTAANKKKVKHLIFAALHYIQNSHDNYCNYRLLMCQSKVLLFL